MFLTIFLRNWASKRRYRRWRNFDLRSISITNLSHTFRRLIFGLVDPRKMHAYQWVDIFIQSLEKWSLWGFGAGKIRQGSPAPTPVTDIKQPRLRGVQKVEMRGLLLTPHLSQLLLAPHLKSLAPHLILRFPDLVEWWIFRMILKFLWALSMSLRQHKPLFALQKDKW